MNWLRPMKTKKSTPIALIAAVAAMGLGTGLAAQETPAAPSDAGGEGVTVELNKLEPSDKGCRAYIVVSNPTEASYDAYKLDLVLFQTDGVIGRRLALDLAPVRADKRTVKLFDLEGTQCDTIGNFLVNDVLDCKTASGPVTNCLANLKVKSLTKAEISK